MPQPPQRRRPLAGLQLSEDRVLAGLAVQLCDQALVEPLSELLRRLLPPAATGRMQADEALLSFAALATRNSGGRR